MIVSIFRFHGEKSWFASWVSSWVASWVVGAGSESWVQPLVEAVSERLGQSKKTSQKERLYFSFSRLETLGCELGCELGRGLRSIP